MGTGDIIQICLIVFAVGAAWATIRKDVQDGKKERKTISDNMLALRLLFEKSLTKQKLDLEGKIVANTKSINQILRMMGLGATDERYIPNKKDGESK